MKDVYFYHTITFETVELLEQKIPINEDWRLIFTTPGGNTSASFQLARILKRNRFLKEIICIDDVASGGIFVLLSLPHIKRVAYEYVTFEVHTLQINWGENSYSYYYIQNYIKNSEIIQNILLTYLKNFPELKEFKKDKHIILNAYQGVERGIIDEVIPFDLI